MTCKDGKPCKMTKNQYRRNSERVNFGVIKCIYLKKIKFSLK